MAANANRPKMGSNSATVLIMTATDDMTKIIWPWAWPVPSMQVPNVAPTASGCVQMMPRVWPAMHRSSKAPRKSAMVETTTVTKSPMKGLPLKRFPVASVFARPTAKSVAKTDSFRPSAKSAHPATRSAMASITTAIGTLTKESFVPWPVELPAVSRGNVS